MYGYNSLTSFNFGCVHLLTLNPNPKIAGLNPSWPNILCTYNVYFSSMIHDLLTLNLNPKIAGLDPSWPHILCTYNVYFLSMIRKRMLLFIYTHI